jgi:hypothetical protein
MIVKLLIAAILGGTGIIGYVYSQPEKDTVIYYETWQDTPQGSKKVDESVRTERPNGDWKQEWTYYHLDGTVFKTQTDYAIAGKGLFRLHPNALEKVAERPAGARPRVLNDGQAKASHSYAGEDKILGYKVFKFQNGQGFDYLAPALGMAYLKIDWGQGRVTIAVKVETVENADFGTLPDLPINDSALKKKDAARKAASGN